MRADSKNNQHWFYDVYVSLLILVCVFGGCSLLQRRVVIPVDFERVHHFSTVGLAEMMNQDIYLWGLQFGLSQCGFLNAPNTGVRKHYRYYNSHRILILLNAFTSQGSQFPCHPHFVESHIYILVSVISISFNRRLNWRFTRFVVSIHC